MAGELIAAEPAALAWKRFIDSPRSGRYDRKRDVLFIAISGTERSPAASIDIAGEFWLRVTPDTSEIVGIEIEDFRRIFLAKNPEIARIWRQAARTAIVIRRHPERKGPVLSIIVAQIQKLFRSHPYQARFA